MSHPRMREYAYRAARSVIDEYHASATEVHPGLKGRIRELALNKLIRPFLPPTIGALTGKVIDARGSETGELDIILYDKEILPPLLYSDLFGLVPVEACLCVIEVKSLLTAAEVERAVTAATALKNLNQMTGTIPLPRRLPDGGVMQDVVECRSQSMPNYVLFSFGSDLTYGASPHDDLERVLNRCPQLHAQTSMTGICVVGRGYWAHTSDQWYFGESNPNLREVVDFLMGIVNTLPLTRAAKAVPNLGAYWSSGDKEYLHPLIGIDGEKAENPPTRPA